MSATQATAPARPGNGLLIAAVLLGLLAALWFFGAREREVQRSAVGFAGLVDWLAAHDLNARRFDAGRLVEGEVGLRILPLHDADLTGARVPPETAEALIAQTSETDIPAAVVAEKLALLPTVVALPKWRSGLRVLGAAHRELLIPGGELIRLLRQLDLGGRLHRHPGGYAETHAPSGTVGLFHAQTLANSGCEPLIGTSEAMLLGRCPLPPPEEERPERPSAFWVLADPDLMNNHGLTLAGNATVALAVMRDLAGAGPVVLDLTDHVATVPPDRDDRRERRWEDLARLFQWPFAVVWVAFGALSGLVLWRALVRYGPVETAGEDEAIRASKEVSIGARARLLRLADHDAELMRMHVATRLQQLAAEMLGPHRPAGAAPLALLTALVGRRAPELARELADAARLPETGRGRTDDLLRRLNRFEAAINRVRDGSGRAAGAR